MSGTITAGYYDCGKKAWAITDAAVCCQTLGFTCLIVCWEILLVLLVLLFNSLLDMISTITIVTITGMI